MRSRKWNGYLLTAVAIATMAVGTALIKVRAENSPPPAAVTIFVSKGTSGKAVADALNKVHAEWYAKG